MQAATRLHWTRNKLLAFAGGVRFRYMNCIERLKAAHKKSIYHRKEILASENCGCFCCGHIFKPSDIAQWTDKNRKGIGQTAFCPKCSIDSVLGDSSGFPITSAFLKAMNSHWFEASD
mgnify:CR=1 FL=1